MTVLKEKVLRKNRLLGEVVVDLQNIGKKYTIHHEKPTLVENIGRVFRSQKREEYWALKNLSLQIRSGEKVGIYGSNGVGKTTLLKIIAGISNVTAGSVKTKGRIISLIDLESGFHPDLTGQENVFLNGLIIGMSKKEIEDRFLQIVDFAEIGDFITAPLYTYSSGMKLRLGFSVAAHSDPDVLLLDENIIAGDEDFQIKIASYLNNFFQKDKTAIIVSHWMDFLKKNCTRLVQMS